MRILVVRTGPLFAHDDTRLYATRLCSALGTLGHSVEMTTLPFSGSIVDLIPETTALRLMDLRHGGDLCIALGPFAHAICHGNKRIWAFDQYDDFYALWGTNFGAVTASHTNVIVRSHVYAMDRAWLLEARQVRTASLTLSEALSTLCGRPTPLLRPGILEDLALVRSEPSPCFVIAGRLSDRSRIPLVTAALEAVPTPARLIILGYESSLEEREYVEQLIAVSPKRSAIELEINPELARFREVCGSAAALIVAGFRGGTADAFMIAAGASRVPVITTMDAGEPAHLIEDGVTGYVVDPQPAALAEAMNRVLTDPKSAGRHGKALSGRLGKLLPGWDTIAMELTR